MGMATNIPPHNLRELIDAICSLIDNPSISIDEIMTILPGPDFPTGGSIAGRSGINSYMNTGRGIVRMRGSMHVEDLPSGKQQIIITQIPYNVNRATEADDPLEIHARRFMLYNATVRPPRHSTAIRRHIIRTPFARETPAGPQHPAVMV